METKPTTLKQGMPKAERNGLFGIEDELIRGAGKPVYAIVRFDTDAVSKKVEAIEYPVLKMAHIEPLLAGDALAEAQRLMAAAQKERTGEDQLDLDFEGEAGE